MSLYLKETDDLQTSLMAMRAVEADSVHDTLSTNMEWHCGGKFYLHESTEKEPLRWLILFSDSRVQPQAAIISKTSPPTSNRGGCQRAFIAISNSIKPTSASSPVSLASFLTGSSKAGFELVSDGMAAYVQSLALSCLSSFNLPYLISLLGQGYQLVISGHRFGGVVANVLASKLLLQVKSELILAEKMGIDLSSLALTQEGVVSFALSSPFFASEGVGRALKEHGLGSTMHSLWHKLDASPFFLTECCNLMNTPTPPSGVRPLPFSSSWLKAAMSWASFVHSEIDKLPRAKLQSWVTGPLEIPQLSSLKDLKESYEGGLVAENSTSSLNSPRESREKASSSIGSPGNREKPANSLSKSVSLSAAKTAALNATRNVTKSQSVGVKKAATVSTATRPANDSHPGSLFRPQLASLIAAIPSLHSDAERGEEMLAPVGQHWVVEESPPAPAPASASGKGSATEPLATLVHLPSDKVRPMLSASLGESNLQLFYKWEFSLEEWIKILPETFVWTKYKTSDRNLEVLSTCK